MVRHRAGNRNPSKEAYLMNIEARPRKGETRETCTAWRLTWTTSARTLERETLRGTYTDARKRWGIRRGQILQQGASYTAPSKGTLGEWLNEWLQLREDDGLSPSTLSGYRLICRLYFDSIKPVSLKNLTPALLASWRTDLIEAHGTTRTSERAVIVLKTALKEAERRERIGASPARFLRPPRPPRPEIQILTPQQVETLVLGAMLLGDKWGRLFSLLTFTGLRLGEALALKRGDIEKTTVGLTYHLSEASALKLGDIGGTEEGHAFRLNIRRSRAHGADNRVIEKETKTQAGRRLVYIAGNGATLLAFQLDNIPDDPNAYVFATAEGKPLSHRNTLRAWRRFIDATNKQITRTRDAKARALPALTLHALRHTYASLLIDRGVDPYTLCQLLGHTDPAFTLRVYGHLYDLKRKEAGKIIADASAIVMGLRPI